MMGRSHGTLLVAALVVALALPASVGMAREDSRGAGRFLAETGGLRLELNASLGLAESRLRVQLLLEDGHVRWTLVDPHGEVHVIGRGEGPVRGMEAPEAGTWVLQLEMGEANGRFWVDWDER